MFRQSKKDQHIVALCGALDNLTYPCKVQKNVAFHLAFECCHMLLGIAHMLMHQLANSRFVLDAPGLEERLVIIYV